MKKYKKLMYLLVGTIMFLVPVQASAHTATVSCGSTGVVFSYENNFPVDTVVTESVNGVTSLYTVKANTASTDTVDSVGAVNVVASATWTGGGTLAPTAIHCPAPSVLPCEPEQVVYQKVYTPGPTVVQYVPYEVDKYVLRYKDKIHYKVRWKTVYKYITIHPVLPPKHPKPDGVTG